MNKGVFDPEVQSIAWIYYVRHQGSCLGLFHVCGRTLLAPLEYHPEMVHADLFNVLNVSDTFVNNVLFVPVSR
jgi:hypothetical protein